MMIELIITHVLYIIVLCAAVFVIILKNRLLEKYRNLLELKTELEESRKRLIYDVLEFVPNPERHHMLEVLEDTKNLSLEELEEYKRGI